MWSVADASRFEETLGYTLSRAAEVGLAMPTIEVCYELLSGLNDFLGERRSRSRRSGAI